MLMLMFAFGVTAAREPGEESSGRVSCLPSMLRRSAGTCTCRLSRFASTQVRAPAPAICAVQIAPRQDKQREVESWLSEGRVILERTLHSHRAKSSTVAAHIVGSDVRSCFHWVHMPSSSESHPDTVAIVFTSDTDLSLWRQSPARAAWLEVLRSAVRTPD